MRLPGDVVVRTLWLERYKLLLAMGLAIGIGVAIALILTPEFRSEARLMPEMNNGSGDVLKRLASMAGFSGVDFSDADELDAVRPDLYPHVLQSTPFVLYLIDQPVTTTAGQSQRLGQFLLPDTKWSFRKLMSLRKGDRADSLGTSPSDKTVRLSVRQQAFAEEISERVRAKFDTRSGIITITATMPDANVAATVAALAMSYLTDYVTTYRTEKARQDLTFYRKQLNAAQNRYKQAQLAVFQYNDHHKNIVMLATTMDRHLMEAELSIAQTVYTELARQFEQSKLRVQARTPIFKVLEPPGVPLKRISPRRTVIVVLFAVVGLVSGALYVLVRKADVAGQLQAMVANTPPEKVLSL
ncbi:lipopolysaccharide biosynthesis protein [Spirosoma radiotolerans]|uniref:Lipopolysaccharide biosynthesis protein n=1 Tax=Spirosoma radiotolerans TaxID=1379870 RepID=A0A0E4A125_9BACT|nr:lipopolysaccharide biosynthesis protein [Spirosoma radiotolerans]